MANETNLIQNFIDNSDAFIYLKDGEGRILMVNRLLAELLKLSKEEVIGKRPTMTFPPRRMPKCFGQTTVK